jgi:hypothetical protein
VGVGLVRTAAARLPISHLFRVQARRKSAVSPKLLYLEGCLSCLNGELRTRKDPKDHGNRIGFSDRMDRETLQEKTDFKMLLGIFGFFIWMLAGLR